MDAALLPPRALTDEESSSLRDLLRSELVTIRSSVDDEEDAEALLDYAADMIEENETVGHLVEELEMMEMPVCDEDAAKKLGELLTEFFLDLDGGALREARDGKKKGASKKWKTVETTAPAPAKTSPPPPPSAPKWKATAPTVAKESPPPPPKAATPEPQLVKKAPALVRRSPSCASTAASTSASVSTAGEDASEADPEPTPVEATTPALSVAARLSSYGASCRSPASPSYISPSSAGRKSYGGRSWAVKEKKEAVSEVAADPAGPSDGDSEPAPEPKPQRASLKDRLAAYQGASSSSSSPTAAPSPSSSTGRRSYGGRSWAVKEKKEAVAAITTDPGTPGDGNSEPEPEAEPEPEPKPEPELEPKRGSLKDRLAAYQQGASSSSKKALPQKHKNDSWLRDRLRSQSTLEDSIKEDENEDNGDEGERIVDFTPVMSLRERMAAFQNGDGNAIPVSQAGM